MPDVLYFHGFASSSTSRKLILLRERLGSSGFSFESPDLNVPSFEKLDWEAMLELAKSGLSSRPDLIVGSSLGALLALDLVHKEDDDTPLVLIAPALGFRERWNELLPDTDPLMVFNYMSQTEVPIHRAFFESEGLRKADRFPPRGPVSVIIGADDETVPLSGVRSIWDRWRAAGGLARGSRLVEIAGADHSLLDHLDDIADEISFRADNSGTFCPARGVNKASM